MKFLSDKADSITLYSETGKISQFDGGKVSFANGKLEISAQTAGGCFYSMRDQKSFCPRFHRSSGVYYTVARLRLYINYSIRHAGESDYRNEQQTSERDDDTAERLYA